MKTQDHDTPAASGFAMPAEWEKHEATWLGWPHNRTDWPGKIAPIHWVYGEIVRKIAPGEIVRILVNSEQHEKQVRRILARVGVDLSRIEFFRFPTNRGWTRDFGPIFVRRNEPPREVAVVRFGFNAWAKYPDWDLDCRIAERVAKAMGRRVFHVQHQGEDVVLEGGAIDINGCGTLLTTEECLLDDRVQVRNPKLGRSDIEQVCRDYLGAGHVLWLARGIVGDDTHGHVDDLCRFVSPGTVVLCQEPNAADENHRILEENRERLEGYRLADGSRIEIVRLPMPEPLYLDGQRLPASYANFYIANSAVLVPTFNDPNDRTALGILAELFADRPVVGIHAVDLVWGLGTLHCLTQQEPAV
ncbi:MAG TPA: agmatine deiminase family protein [Sedimentisphaerales bacterium]|nr:agmatine deiminase family protein [Sedimentisphaerales bacterium]HRS13235.1 agmatine deiminase family protein [Sedimentisphaerales bacterium]HRV49821.1 agmatine deiminase family protein [Sedimentisphaerales bacterium]